ncbi:polysaccharide pyruvyl transferase family protein [Methylolobus aquaticus]|nr:polysaccharide pyruvyl transferase family protein [Methylolobus aquaticus]
MSIPLKKIAVMTRLSTQNAGNEALSLELISLLRSIYGVNDIRALDRYPRHLEHITLSKLRGEPDVIRAFERIAQNTIRKANPSSSGVLAPFANSKTVTLSSRARELPSGLKKIKRLIGFRRNLARFGLIEKTDFKRTLNTCAWCDLFIWNPAGEFHPSGDVNQTLRLLLLVRIAQILGKRTAIINHSLEVEDETLSEIIRYVYSLSDLVTVREKGSLSVAVERLRIPSEKVTQVPDLVFLTARKPAVQSAILEPPFEKGAIGLAINGLEAKKGVDEWAEFMGMLEKLGRQIVFVSNAMHKDLPFGAELKKHSRVLVFERTPSAEELIRIYSRMDALVSSRLHAAVLALLTGTPVITIEPQLFKISGIFEDLKYPYQTDFFSNEGWAKRTFARVKDATEHGEKIRAAGINAVETFERRILQTYTERFREIEKHTIAMVTER